jgi:hypothetical protein
VWYKKAKIAGQRIESTPRSLGQIEAFVNIGQELAERLLPTKQLKMQRPGYRGLVAMTSSSGSCHQGCRRMGSKEIGQRLLYNSPT